MLVGVLDIHLARSLLHGVVRGIHHPLSHGGQLGRLDTASLVGTGDLQWSLSGFSRIHGEGCRGTGLHSHWLDARSVAFDLLGIYWVLHTHTERRV